MYPASVIASYILSQQDEEAGDLISNLKLQKLLYYAQGYYLALHNEPLFPEKIEAWNHGPVVPKVYHEYKQFGANALAVRKCPPAILRDKKTKSFLDEILKVIGQFSAWRLRNATHSEPPWRNAEHDAVIPLSELKNYFKTKLA